MREKRRLYELVWWRTFLVATLCLAMLSSCGGEYRTRTFEVESVSWTVFTHPLQLPQGGYDALVRGFVVMDAESGCIYLQSPDFDIAYPVVWPRGTKATTEGLALRDDRVISEGEWVSGGGGYLKVSEVSDHCLGVSNQYSEVAVFNSGVEDIEIGR